MTHQLVSILFTSILSRIQSQSTNVTSPIDKVCMIGSLRSDIDGMYQYSFWNSTVNAPVYYNTENNKYLHPYILTNSSYRYEIDDVPGSGMRWSHSTRNINNSSNEYVFNPDDFFNGWQTYNDSQWTTDSNLRLVNCNDLCITGNDIPNLDGTYIWTNFSLAVNSSIYYSSIYYNTYSAAYLYGFTATQWLIGPYPLSNLAWSNCTSSSPISNERLNLDDCNEWHTYNGSTFQIETNMAVNKYKCPTIAPTSLPTTSPTPISTMASSSNPTKLPSNYPTKLPSNYPTKLPSNYPTKLPSNYPTKSPSNDPTKSPSNHPTKLPSSSPSDDPTNSLSDHPTNLLSISLTELPSNGPTKPPTNNPTKPSLSITAKSENEEFVNDHGIIDNKLIIGILIGFGCCMIPLLIGIVIWCCIYHRKNRNVVEGQTKIQINNNEKKQNVEGEVNMMKLPEINCLDNHSLDTHKKDVSSPKFESVDSVLSDGMYDNGDQYTNDTAHTLGTSQGGEYAYT